MVRTVTGGYYKASGTFTLPSVNLKSSLSDPDVPYGFFGIYVSDKIGLDLGTYYSQKMVNGVSILVGILRIRPENMRITGDPLQSSILQVNYRL